MVAKKMQELEHTLKLQVVVDYYGKEAVEPWKIIQTISRCLYNEFGGCAHVVYKNEVQYFKDDVEHKEIDLRSSLNGSAAVDSVSEF